MTALLRCALGTASVFASLALPALAQDASAGTDAVAERIKEFVTGSNIPTIERETALPVQIITREDIERASIQTAAELVNTISATMSFSAFNQVQGSGGLGTAGFAGAALRGLEYQATLILVNGRRIANWAFTTLGGDPNSIPMAAVERVENHSPDRVVVVQLRVLLAVYTLLVDHPHAVAGVVIQRAGFKLPQHEAVVAPVDVEVKAKVEMVAVIDRDKMGSHQRAELRFARPKRIVDLGAEHTLVRIDASQSDLHADDAVPVEVSFPGLTVMPRKGILSTAPI